MHFIFDIEIVMQMKNVTSMICTDMYIFDTFVVLNSAELNEEK